MSDGIHLIAVFVENKPGQTARVSRILADAGINICWLTIANNGSFGVMKFLVDKRDQAVETLKGNGLMVSLVPVLAVQTDNQPGALQRVTEILWQKNINLDYCSGFMAGANAVLLVEVQQIEPARSALESEHFRLLSQEALLNL
jgi:hypothetical protein